MARSGCGKRGVTPPWTWVTSERLRRSSILPRGQESLGGGQAFARGVERGVLGGPLAAEGLVDGATLPMVHREKAGWLQTTLKQLGPEIPRRVAKELGPRAARAVGGREVRPLGVARLELPQDVEHGASGRGSVLVGLRVGHAPVIRP